MTWGQIGMLAILAIFLILLIRAAVVLGKQNPYQRIEEIEKLGGGKLPQDMSFAEKQRMLDRFGIARRNTKQSFAYIGIVLIGALVTYLMTSWAQPQKLPEAHTDFIVTLQWGESAWLLALLVVGVAVLVGVLLYRRRRRD